MVAATLRGASSPARTGRMPPSSRADIDREVRDLAAHKDDWAWLGIALRLALLERLSRDFSGVTARWVEACPRCGSASAGRRRATPTTYPGARKQLAAILRAHPRRAERFGGRQDRPQKSPCRTLGASS